MESPEVVQREGLRTDTPTHQGQPGRPSKLLEHHKTITLDKTQSREGPQGVAGQGALRTNSQEAGEGSREQEDLSWARKRYCVRRGAIAYPGAPSHFSLAFTLCSL